MKLLQPNFFQSSRKFKTQNYVFVFTEYLLSMLRLSTRMSRMTKSIGMIFLKYRSQQTGCNPPPTPLKITQEYVDFQKSESLGLN